jgi:hypothetical protein
MMEADGEPRPPWNPQEHAEKRLRDWYITGGLDIEEFEERMTRLLAGDLTASAPDPGGLPTVLRA